MKKSIVLSLVVVFSFLSVNSFSQENKSGFVTAITAQMGSANRTALEIGYQYSDAYLYAEGSFGTTKRNEYVYSIPSIKIGFEYSFASVKNIDFVGGMFAGYSYYTNKVDQVQLLKHTNLELDAFEVGVRLGAKINFGSKMFFKVMGTVSSSDFDRYLYLTKSTATKGIWDAGLLAGVGIRF